MKTSGKLRPLPSRRSQFCHLRPQQPRAQFMPNLIAAPIRLLTSEIHIKQIIQPPQNYGFLELPSKSPSQSLGIDFALRLASAPLSSAATAQPRRALSRTLRFQDFRTGTLQAAVTLTQMNSAVKTAFNFLNYGLDEH
jgi:hypothetical protein